jgi:hypothetical protein
MIFDPRQRRAALHNFLVTHKIRPYPLVQAAGLSESVVRGYLAGRSSSITDKNYEKLAEAASALLGRRVTADELRGEITQRTDLAIDAYLGTDSTILDYSGTEPVRYVKAPDDLADGGALMVKDSAGLPMFEAGDVLIWAKPDSDVTPALGKIAVVQIKNGPRVLRRLMRGRGRYRYHLLAINSSTPPLEDRLVLSVAPIVWVRRA